MSGSGLATFPNGLDMSVNGIKKRVVKMSAEYMELDIFRGQDILDENVIAKKYHDCVVL